ncbi:MAG TPA: sulfotransferase [Xanthomonadaceae bacterium]|nr:sulfotransferase [Xanthomonadaceae bacterium]
MSAEPAASLEVALAHAQRLLASDPALAAEQACEILRVVPGQPVAQRLLAAAHVLRGDVDGALAILQPLAQQHPQWARVQLDLGLALGRARRGAEALAALQRAVALDPKLPGAWRALGDHLAGAGDTAGADAAYAAHVRHSPADPALLAAAHALAEGRIPEAEAQLRALLRRAPTDVAAIRMLAEVAARQQHALVLNRGNRHAEALAEVEALLAIEPANPGYRNLKAVILGRIGDYPRAIALYDQLLAEYPAHAQLSMSYGHALKTAGDTPRAVEAYRRSIALDPACGEAYWSLANLKTFRFDDDDVAAMRAQLARADLADDARLHFEFALGKAGEDAGEHAQSFAHYARGNALRRAQLPYDADDNHARVERARRTYTRDFLAARAGWGAQARDPIFIVGLPRAGSTLLEQILSSHSQVEGTMELPEVIALTRELRRAGGVPQSTSYHDVLAGLDAAAVRGLGERYLERTRIQRHGGAPLFIDKMPNNFAHVGLIHLALPNARIIDARRHPLACCFSAFKQHFARGQAFSYGLADLGRYYRDYVALMAHFDAVLPGRVHRVTYERLVEDTEAEVRRLLGYCGLPFEDACLRFHENPRAVRTASSEQVRRPIYRDGVDHWRRFEPWLAPLKEALGPVLDAYPEAPAFPPPG